MPSMNLSPSDIYNLMTALEFADHQGQLDMSEDDYKSLYDRLEAALEEHGPQDGPFG